MLSHLPKYTEKELILPSHLDLDIRVITLPECYASLGSKEKQKVLALMACVRLHKNSLLSDRLLPLTRSDLQQKILEQATEEPRRIPTNNFRGASDFRRLIVYPFRQENRRIEKLHKTLRSKGHSLAIITTEYLGEIPPMRVAHELFGGVTCSLGEPFVSECNEEQLQLILRFFKLMMDCRWRRRSKGVFFRPKSLDDLTQLIPPYFVGCLSKEGEIDWAEMTKLVDQSKRSEYERTVAAQAHDPSIDGPRLVAPLYDPAVTYIMYGPSEETCASPFPSEREGVVTFQDYFGLCRGYDVEEV